MVKGLPAIANLRARGKCRLPCKVTNFSHCPIALCARIARLIFGHLAVPARPLESTRRDEENPAPVPHCRRDVQHCADGYELGGMGR